MYASGVKIAHCDQNAMDDGYIRTFRKAEIPEFSVQELNMIKGWLEEGKIEEIGIFLTNGKFKSLNSDIAGFCLRELIRGNL